MKSQWLLHRTFIPMKGGAPISPCAYHTGLSFDCSHPHACAVELHCGFDFHVPDANEVSRTHWPVVCLLWRNVFIAFAQFSIRLFCSLIRCMLSVYCLPFCGSFLFSWQYCLQHKYIHLDDVQLVYFFFIACAFGLI